MARLSDVEALVKAAEAPPKQTPAIEVGWALQAGSVGTSNLLHIERSC